MIVLVHLNQLRRKDRYVRANLRKEKVADAVSSLLSLKKRKIDFDNDNTHNILEFNVPGTSCDTQMMNLREDPVSDDHDIDNHQSTRCEVQTYITKVDISQMEDDLSARIVEKEQESVKMFNVYSFSFLFKTSRLCFLLYWNAQY